MEQAQQLDGEERLIQARTVMNAVQMSMDSNNPQSRAEAEAALRNWESDAAPGFLQALLDISRETSAVSEVEMPLFAPFLTSLQQCLTITITPTAAY